MTSRRQFISAASLAGTAGVLGLTGGSRAAGEDYRALVVVYLAGGYDGHNMLLATDGGYNVYQSARQNLALARTSLAPLPGSAIGHTFGLHPALQPLVPLYERKRLAFVANVGPLVEPCTAQQVLDRAANLPPFLLSHSDQEAIVQGWTVTDDSSGWAGRALELLPSRLRHKLAAVTNTTQRTLVLGRRSPVSFLDTGATSSWVGVGDLRRPDGPAMQILAQMAQSQSMNLYEAEYARTMGLLLSDSMFAAEALAKAKPPTADFGSESQGIALGLRGLASVLPAFKAQGLKRQVFLHHWGSFDTHTNQRGSDPSTQDAQLAVAAKALAAFDQTVRENGLDDNVVTLVMTEFGRTTRPGSGGGSEHAWGNHWFVFGGPVDGGTVIGEFPSLLLGGPDDCDPGKNGRIVPKISTDQVAATLMHWIGLEPSQFLDVFPWLVNFDQKTVPLLRV